MDLLMFDVVLETDGVSSELLPLDEPRTEIRKRTYKNGNDVIRIHDETSFSTSSDLVTLFDASVPKRPSGSFKLLW